MAMIQQRANRILERGDKYKSDVHNYVRRIRAKLRQCTVEVNSHELEQGQYTNYNRHEGYACVERCAGGSIHFCWLCFLSEAPLQAAKRDVGAALCQEQKTLTTASNNITTFSQVW